MTDAVNAMLPAHRSSSPHWSALQIILTGVSAAQVACQRRDTQGALDALCQLQDTLDPEQSASAAELFVLYRSLTHLVDLGAWDMAVPILAALQDACLHALAETRGGTIARIL